MNYKNFDCNRNKQITKNINVLDLKCKGQGHIHNTFVDIEFINDIQNFIDKQEFDKIEIINGYLCNEYARKMGKDSDYSKGKKIDIVFYKENKKVSSNEVCDLAKASGINAIKCDEYCVTISKGTPIAIIPKPEIKIDEPKVEIRKVEKIETPKEEIKKEQIEEVKETLNEIIEKEPKKENFKSNKKKQRKDD